MGIENVSDKAIDQGYVKFKNIFKLVFYSAFGAFMFFIPVTVLSLTF